MKPHEADWLEPMGRNLWRTTRDLHFEFAGRDIVVPAGFETDLFTLVDNTPYPAMWRSSILHDYMCRNKHLFPRDLADVLFLADMACASVAIYYQLMDQGRTERQARKEMRRICNKAVRYYAGVTLWTRIKGWF
jgi:hypothetical protein